LLLGLRPVSYPAFADQHLLPSPALLIVFLSIEIMDNFWCLALNFPP
jgi:hypothetical protein